MYGSYSDFLIILKNVLYSNYYCSSHQIQALHSIGIFLSLCVAVIQSCLTLCNPMDCSLPGSSVQNSPRKNTGERGLSLPQGLFLTQRSNPGLLHCRQILYHLSHQGSLLQSRMVLWIFHVVAIVTVTCLKCLGQLFIEHPTVWTFLFFVPSGLDSS